MESFFVMAHLFLNWVDRLNRVPGTMRTVSSTRFGPRQQGRHLLGSGKPDLSLFSDWCSVFGLYALSCFAVIMIRVVYLEESVLVWYDGIGRIFSWTRSTDGTEFLGRCTVSWTRRARAFRIRESGPFAFSAGMERRGSLPHTFFGCMRFLALRCSWMLQVCRRLPNGQVAVAAFSRLFLSFSSFLFESWFFLRLLTLWIEVNCILIFLFHMREGANTPQLLYLFAMSCFQMNLLCEADAALYPLDEHDTEVCNHSSHVKWSCSSKCRFYSEVYILGTIVKHLL